MKYVLIPVLARNALLTKETEQFLEKLKRKADNPQVKKYIDENIRKYLINEYKEGVQHHQPKSTDPDWVERALSNGDTVFDVDILPKDKQKFEHYVDYLNTVKPEKVFKIGVASLEQLVKKWEESFQKVTEGEDGVKDLHVYPNGYKWVNVFGRESLNREGKLMDHCAGSYYKSVSSGKTLVYSLRSPNNKPHVTIEFDFPSKSIEQIKGHSNNPVKEKYLNYVVDFIEKRYVNWIKIEHEELLENGLIYLRRQLYKLEELPDNILYRGNLDLEGAKISRLPHNLNVRGDLILKNSTITELPEDLKVSGNLNCENTDIETVPSTIRVGGILNLLNTRIKSRDSLKLPNVKGKIRTNIDVTINGIRYSIYDLPDGLTVNSDLVLGRRKLPCLPNNLTVNGSLDLHSVTIERLPDKLTVAEDLDLSGAKKITSIPGDIIVEGDINLRYSDVKELPDNWTVGGSLDLRGANIQKLPDNLTVADSLYVSYTKIKELPDSLSVGEKIVADKEQFKKVPQALAEKIVVDDDEEDEIQ